MRYIDILAIGVACLNACDALPSSSLAKYAVHEKRDSTGWRAAQTLKKRDRVHIARSLPVRIGLAQRDLDLGHDWLMDIAHPSSPNYGKHWTSQQVNKAFAPTAETVQTVRDWLINSGIAASRISVSDNKGWLGFDATIEEAESLFQAQYYEHEHPDANKYTVGCDEYSLPEHIRQHVDYVTPGVKHHVYKRAESTAIGGISNLQTAPIVSPLGVIDVKTVPVNCSSYVVSADCIRALYQMPDLNPNRTIPSTNSLGIYESGESYSQADLNLFFKNFAPFIPNNTQPELLSVDGGIGPVSQAQSGGEAMLDFTIAYALTYPQPLEFFSVDDPYWVQHSNGFLDTLLDSWDGSFCTYSAFGQKGDNNTIDPVYPDPHNGGYKGPLMCGTYEPPKVFSLSYSEGELYVPVNYIKRQCNEWMKLSLQGTTISSSSGDYGVSTRPRTYGVANGCQGPNSTIFTPSWINECPYVLSVGATTIQAGKSGYQANPEEAVYEQFVGSAYPYTSGSGFSNIFDRPDYQNVAVKTYFQTADPGWPYYSTTNGKDIGKNGGLYNRAGRAYPDVSANGAWWYDYVNGTLGRTGGTSMSAPLFASVLTLINEARLKNGKTTIGWVHPTIYAHPEAFHDITIGANQGCGKQFAFNATIGWDPPTGLGTPNFNKLKQIFMSLP